MSLLDGGILSTWLLLYDDKQSAAGMQDPELVLL